MKAVLLVLTNPASPEADAKYNEWYTNEHIPDVLAVPGYTQASRWRVFDSWSPFNQKYFATYELEVESEKHLRSISDEHLRRISANEMRRSPTGAIDTSSMRAMYYLEVEPEQTSPVPQPQVPSSIFVTYNQPLTPQLAEEYNHWYRDLHLPDVLACPGFIRAQRFRRANFTMLEQPWVTNLEYVNIYQHTAATQEEYDTSFDAIRDGIKKGTIVMTDTLTPDAPTSVYGRICDPQFANR